MQNSDRNDFTAQLGALCAGFNVPLGDRVEAYWRGLAKMELRTFVRVVEHCLGEEGPEKIPTTRQCWSLAKVIRPARFVAPEPEKPQWQGDKWDIDANHHLRLHVRNHPHKYAPDSTYDSLTRQAVAGPLTIAYTAILVRWKKTWAEDMRVLAKPSADEAWDTWCECMEGADAQIARLQTKEAA